MDSLAKPADPKFLLPLPIYDTCPWCRLPIRPGESHGQMSVQADPEGEPAGMVCKIKKLVMAEEEIHSAGPQK